MREKERERERPEEGRGERTRRAYEWISSYGGRGVAEITIGFHVPYTPRPYTYVRPGGEIGKKKQERETGVFSFPAGAY